VINTQAAASESAKTSEILTLSEVAVLFAAQKRTYPDDDVDEDERGTRSWITNYPEIDEDYIDEDDGEDDGEEQLEPDDEFEDGLDEGDWE
jgi:hypothetical protein